MGNKLRRYAGFPADPLQLSQRESFGGRQLLATRGLFRFAGTREDLSNFVIGVSAFRHTVSS
jgi:hypothetical protein